MGPFGLLLAVSIISLSAGDSEDIDDNLAIQSLFFLDKPLYEFYQSEEEKCGMIPTKKQEKREPYPGYIPDPGSYTDRYYIKGAPETSQSIPERPETSNSGGTLDSGKMDELEMLISNILDQAATSQPSEECCGSPENSEGGSSNGEASSVEASSVEENVSSISGEDSEKLESHEFQDMVRSVHA